MRVIFASALLALLLFACLTVPGKTWIYQDNRSRDSEFEKFGPRADKLLMKLYPDAATELAALSRGEIDIADQALSKQYYDVFMSNAVNPDTGLPYNATINTVSYGSNYDLFLLDINNNNNQFLGNPPNLAYPNPVYPNPCSVRELRQAIAHLVNRSQLDTIVGRGLYVPLYTVVPPSLGSYAHPEIRPGGTLANVTYPYSRAAAEALLESNGFPINATTGWRFWDLNHNGVEEPDEYIELKFFIRYEDYKRRTIGDSIANELIAVKVRVHCYYNIVSDLILDQVFKEKNFHLYTGGWKLGVDPDYLTLWNWNYYWHPGKPYNYAGINNPDFNAYSNSVQDAITLQEAKTSAQLAQEIFASEALSVPLYSTAGNKAMNRIYTGGNEWMQVTPDDGENSYRGEYWEGTVDRLGYGIDDFQCFLNMHPQGHEEGDGENMTIRWGCVAQGPGITELNPILATWQSGLSARALFQIYDSLLLRNPNDPAEFIPWLAENFEVGTYTHPGFGECTKIKFTMHQDATWHDGAPVTAADVYFTWVELWQILKARGIMMEPWWSGIGPLDKPIQDFEILDPYNFEVLFNFQSVWTLSWISEGIILPKHIWKTIAEIGDPEAFAPDPNLVGSGPWRLEEYVEGSHLLLVANRLEETVKTNLVGSVPVTSHRGYWRYSPLSLESMVDGANGAKIDYYSQPHSVSFTVINLCFDKGVTVDIYQTVSYSNGTTSETTFPNVYLNASGMPDSAWMWTYSDVMKGKVKINTEVHVPGENVWLNSTKIVWVTINEDIVGSTFYDDIELDTYPFKSQLPTPDFKVDISDIATVAKAFGAYPGHIRWNAVADVNNNHNIDILDIALVAKRFGWTGPP